MVKIYTVKIKFDFIPPPRLDEEGVEIEEDIQVIEGDFQVGADSLPEAMEAAFEHLDANMGETEYEMVSLSLVENMGIVNWPGEGGECNCPICKANTCAVEDLLVFTCSHCEEEVRLSDGEWNECPCPFCGIIIGRDQIISIGKGKYMMIAPKMKGDIGNDESQV